MLDPKQTTTGEVICETCGWLHPSTAACPVDIMKKPQRITAAHVRAANMSAAGRDLIIGSPEADEYVANFLNGVK